MKTHTILIAGLALLRQGNGVTAAELGEMGIETDLAGRLMPRATAAATSVNLQTFTGALGGAAADPITSSGNATRPFAVAGSPFADFQSAAARSCAGQHSACAVLASRAPPPSDLAGGVAACDAQRTSCEAAASAATQTAFPTLVSSNAEFDFFCDP